MKLTKFLWEIKEGLVIGGIIGFVVGKYFFPNVFDLNAVAQTQSVLDIVKSASQPAIEFAKDKLVIVSTVVGALAGATIDAMIPERKWERGL